MSWCAWIIWCSMPGPWLVGAGRQVTTDDLPPSFLPPFDRWLLSHRVTCASARSPAFSNHDCPIRPAKPSDPACPCLCFDLHHRCPYRGWMPCPTVRRHQQSCLTAGVGYSFLQTRGLLCLRPRLAAVQTPFSEGTFFETGQSRLVPTTRPKFLGLHMKQDLRGTLACTTERPQFSAQPTQHPL